MSEDDLYQTYYGSRPETIEVPVSSFRKLEEDASKWYAVEGVFKEYEAGHGVDIDDVVNEIRIHVVDDAD